MIYIVWRKIQFLSRASKNSTSVSKDEEPVLLSRQPGVCTVNETSSSVRLRLTELRMLEKDQLVVKFINDLQEGLNSGMKPNLKI